MGKGGWGGEHEDFHKKSTKTFTRTYILDEEAAVVDEGQEEVNVHFRPVLQLLHDAAERIESHGVVRLLRLSGVPGIQLQ